MEVRHHYRTSMLLDPLSRLLESRLQFSDVDVPLRWIELAVFGQHYLDPGFVEPELLLGQNRQRLAYTLMDISLRVWGY